jgi:integrase
LGIAPGEAKAIKSVSKQLEELDISDIDLVEMRIRLKSTDKRTNRTVFFDDEAAFILRRWLAIRQGINQKGSTAFFLNAE